MSRSTFDSIIDDYIENDWEKKSAFGVSLTVMIILTTFFLLLFSALSVSLGVQHGNQSRKIAFDICSKERKTDYYFLDLFLSLQFQDWEYLGRNSTEDQSWCDDRIFSLPFVLAEQCPCFVQHLKPSKVKPLWPFTGEYGTALSKH